MSRNFQYLPTELLLAIFNYVDVRNMIEYQQVCKSWLYPARIKLYFNLVISTNAALHKAIYSFQVNRHLAKHLSLDSIESFQEYAPGPDPKKLLVYCSNIKSVSSAGTTMDAQVLEVLACLRSHRLSKLQRIPTAFVNCSEYIKCAYKCRKSLTEVYLDHDKIDNALISTVKQFPELVSFACCSQRFPTTICCARIEVLGRDQRTGK